MTYTEKGKMPESLRRLSAKEKSRIVVDLINKGEAVFSSAEVIKKDQLKWDFWFLRRHYR